MCCDCEDGDFDNLSPSNVTSVGRECYESSESTSIDHERCHTQKNKLTETTIICVAEDVFIFVNI